MVLHGKPATVEGSHERLLNAFDIEFRAFATDPAPNVMVVLVKPIRKLELSWFYLDCDFSFQE